MPFVFGGRKLSLTDVAGLIRSQFPDPRPFLVMAGPARGPPLAREAFEAKDLEERLEAAHGPS